MVSIIRCYIRWVDWFSEKVGIAAMALIALMIGVLLLDAVTRNVIRMPLHWCVEFAQFTLAAYYFMGGAMTLKNEGDHVRMDLIYSRLSEHEKAAIDLATMFCLLFYLSVLLVGSISSLEYALATGERRFSIWNPSMIPIKMLMTACLALMILQTISLAFKYWAKLRGTSFA